MTWKQAGRQSGGLGGGGGLAVRPRGSWRARLHATRRKRRVIVWHRTATGNGLWHRKEIQYSAFTELQPAWERWITPTTRPVRDTWPSALPLFSVRLVIIINGGDEAHLFFCSSPLPLTCVQTQECISISMSIYSFLSVAVWFVSQSIFVVRLFKWNKINGSISAHFHWVTCWSIVPMRYFSILSLQWTSLAALRAPNMWVHLIRQTLQWRCVRFVCVGESSSPSCSVIFRTEHVFECCFHVSSRLLVLNRVALNWHAGCFLHKTTPTHKYHQRHSGRLLIWDLQKGKHTHTCTRAHLHGSF